MVFDDSKMKIFELVTSIFLMKSGEKGELGSSVTVKVLVLITSNSTSEFEAVKYEYARVSKRRWKMQIMFYNLNYEIENRRNR